MEQNPQETYYVIECDGRYLGFLAEYQDRLAHARPFFDKDACLGYRDVMAPGAKIMQVWIEAESLDNAETT